MSLTSGDRERLIRRRFGAASFAKLGLPADDPDLRLYRLLERTEGDLAHDRYNAIRRQLVSFADCCRLARIDSA